MAARRWLEIRAGNRMLAVLASLLVCAGIASCGQQEPGQVDPLRDAKLTSAVDASALVGKERRGETAAELHRIVDDYFEQILELNPVYASFIGDQRYDDRFANDIGSDYRASSRRLETRYLDKIRALDKTELAGQDLLSYEIFERNRKNALEGFRYPHWLMPVSQFYSTPNFFAQLGSGASVQKFNTVRDYDNFLKRIDGFVVWVDQAIVNLREGMQTGVMRPRVIMEKTLPQLAAQVVGDPRDSMFYRPIEQMPASFPSADKSRLAAAWRQAIETQLVPAYRRLHDFIRDEYLPAAPDEVGLAALPNGRAWYNYRIKMSTTTALTADQIHAIGLREVERIRTAMNEVRVRVGFAGTLAEFLRFMKEDPQFYFDSPDELLDGYRKLKQRVDAAIPELFSLRPEADFDIRPVEAFRAKSAAGASYMPPSPDGSRPGVFYVNTYDLKARPNFELEAIFIHEAAPGHHFQISLQQSLQELPRFRRFGGFPAYSEGWGLYSESLGPELGLYADDYQFFGALSAEMLRAIRLVVDTGMHAKGWTREQALDYMLANSPMGRNDAIAEIERYIAIPGQALAYKIGQLKISELRKRAEASLGERFDIRDFHAQILGDGALPLDVLEVKIERWLVAQSKSKRQIIDHN